MFLTLSVQKNVNMKFKQFRLIIPLFAVIFLASCLSTDDTTYSENPTFVSLTFADNDSIPDLSSADFTLEWDELLDDSVIVNLDSLPYQTRIDSVNPTFTFQSTGAKLLYYQNDDVLDSVYLTGTDTIDFTNVVKIKNYAADVIHLRTYPIKVNVHQVSSELYIWNKVSDNIDNHNALNQKAVYFNDLVFYYLKNNTANYAYVSANGYDWSSKTITGLPSNCTFSDLNIIGSIIYVTAADNKIYSSADGLNWTPKVQFTDYTFVSLLCTLNSNLCAVVKLNSDQNYYFANSINGEFSDATVNQQIKYNFPISDFTSISFKSRTGKSKAMIIGGKSADGTTLKTNWNTENGTYWIDFSIENKTLDTLATGASVISYDDKLFLFGVRNDSTVLTSHYKVSIDEGFSWHKPDTAYNVLPEEYLIRNYTSAIVFNPMDYDETITYTSEQVTNSNRIFLFGGKTATQNLSDIWTGKLNRKGFLLQ